MTFYLTMWTVFSAIVCLFLAILTTFLRIVRYKLAIVSYKVRITGCKQKCEILTFLIFFFSQLHVCLAVQTFCLTTKVSLYLTFHIIVRHIHAVACYKVKKLQEKKKFELWEKNSQLSLFFIQWRRRASILCTFAACVCSSSESLTALELGYVW